MRQQKLPLVFVALVSMTLSGCGTMQAYPGERLTGDQVALVKYSFKGPRLELVAGDGQPLGDFEVQAESLPSHHTIDARVVMQSGNTLPYMNVTPTA